MTTVVAGSRRVLENRCMTLVLLTLVLMCDIAKVSGLMQKLALA